MQDANPLAKAKVQGVQLQNKTLMQIVDGKFKDDRWVDGRWDLSQFAGPDGNTDWDKASGRHGHSGVHHPRGPGGILGAECHIPVVPVVPRPC